jgi:hypothetical protein
MMLCYRAFPLASASFKHPYNLFFREPLPVHHGPRSICQNLNKSAGRILVGPVTAIYYLHMVLSYGSRKTESRVDAKGTNISGLAPIQTTVTVEVDPFYASIKGKCRGCSWERLRNVKIRRSQCVV